MGVSNRTKLVIWSRSGGTCAFPGCRKPLVVEATSDDQEALVGEIAHIVAQSDEGPRGGEDPPGGDTDAAPNLILLCTDHHSVIDQQEKTYPVAKLVQIKAQHENWVSSTLSREQRFAAASSPQPHVTESLASSLLPVTRMPRTVFSAPCTASERTVAETVRPPEGSSVMLPFIIREKRLMTFADLDARSPFSQFVDLADVKPHPAMDWWIDPDRFRWYVQLLNRSLNKLTGRRGLLLDKEHARYYFPPDEDGKPRTVVYLTLQNRKSTKSVAWQPKRRSTGLPKTYWEHFAVSISFHYVAKASWCLSLRPERRFTRDGYAVLTPRGTGRRSTSRKSRMYNVDFLKELHFWRDFLCQGSPRIILDFGKQQIIVHSQVLEPDIEWPGVEDDEVKLAAIKYEDDLFTDAELRGLLDLDEDKLDVWEEDET